MEDLADAIESMEQLVVGWRELVLDRDATADVRDLPGIAVRWADSRFAFWNCVTLTDVGAGPGLVRQRLSEAAEIMRAKRRPGYELLAFWCAAVSCSAWEEAETVRTPVC